MPKVVASTGWAGSLVPTLCVGMHYASSVTTQSIVTRGEVDFQMVKFYLFTN